MRKREIHQNEEAGQSLVIFAGILVVLLLFAGLTVDVGVIYARRIQLSRAVDAAALAGVVDLPKGVDDAEYRARQFMRANAVDPDGLLRFEVIPASDPTDASNVLTVNAEWRLNTILMHLIGIETVDVPATATAEYRSYIDMYTSQTGESGKLGPVNLSVFGPKQSPRYGDAYTCPKADVPGKNGWYDPTTDDSAPPNPNHDDLPNGYPFHINVPAGVTGVVRVEILDPECYNAPNGETIVISKTLPVTSSETIVVARNSNPDDVTHTYGDYIRTRTEAFAIDRDELQAVDGNPEDHDSNQFWFVRMDENRLYTQTPGSYKAGADTETEYRLLYKAERPDGSIESVRIATYIGQPDNSHSTDLKWVSPGGSAPQDPHSAVTGYNGHPASFEVDMSTLTDIRVNEDGSRSLFLEVEAVDGWSENGFDLWAGPRTAANLAMPADVNARNVYIDRLRYQDVQNPHDSAGVVCYGSGHLPLNVNQDATYKVTLAYIPSEAAGVWIRVYHWDTDVGGQYIKYFFEGYPGDTDGQLSGNNSWTPPAAGFDRVRVPDGYVGGFLYAEYAQGRQDTSTWRMEYEDIVGDTFVRLIK
jgi:hypothetical protein